MIDLGGGSNTAPSSDLSAQLANLCKSFYLEFHSIILNDTSTYLVIFSVAATGPSSVAAVPQIATKPANADDEFDMFSQSRNVNFAAAKERYGGKLIKKIVSSYDY